MTDRASSLEQAFGFQPQADRESRIAELRRIEAAGRGSCDIASHAITLPLLCGLFGAILIWAGITGGFPLDQTVTVCLIGAAFVLSSAWALFAPRKPRFTLSAEGVRVKDTLLPWDSIEECGVTENSVSAVTTHTSVVFNHFEGFIPPKLTLFAMFGTTAPIRSFTRKTGRYRTRLTLFVGARGMSSEKLANRISDYRSAAYARAELARLKEA